jgi:exosome complex exonuclease DIS3/RRP44
MIRCTREGQGDYYVVIHKDDGSRTSVQIRGRECVNRAIDGDVVAVELIDSRSMNIDVRDLSIISSGVVAETAEPTIEAIEGLPLERSTVQHGRVVGIVRRNWRQYAGSLVSAAEQLQGNASGTHENNVDGALDLRSETLLFRPVDKKIPCILITSRRRAELEGQRLLVAIGKSNCILYSKRNFVWVFNLYYGSRRLVINIRIPTWSLRKNARERWRQSC